jgi:hypothetical protein
MYITSLEVGSPSCQKQTPKFKFGFFPQYLESIVQGLGTSRPENQFNCPKPSCDTTQKGNHSPFGIVY